jgi:hypothetical protein
MRAARPEPTCLGGDETTAREAANKEGDFPDSGTVRRAAKCQVLLDTGSVDELSPVARLEQPG